MAFSSLQNGMATSSTTKWLSPGLQNGMATNSTLQNGVPCQLSWTFFIHNDFEFSSKNGRTFAFMLPKKLQGHVAELPPCPELSSKGNFSIAILKGFYPVTRSFSISPKIDKNCFSIFARGQTVHLFANNMLTFWKHIKTKEW